MKFQSLASQKTLLPCNVELIAFSAQFPEQNNGEEIIETLFPLRTFGQLIQQGK